MKCPNCGLIIPDGSDFCDNCGTFVTEESNKSDIQDNEPDIPIEKRLFMPEIFNPPQETKKHKKTFDLSESPVKPILIVICAVLAALLIIKLYSQVGRRRAIAGIGEPVQEETAKYFEKQINGYDVSIYANYTYEIEALVVHTKNYIGFSFGNRLSPKDVALAWGRVAEYNKTIDFNWRQSGRFCYWRLNSYDDILKVGGEDYINTHISNNHLIPADKSVKRKIKKIKKGDHIKIIGYLVDIDAENKKGKIFTWNSSTTRDDTGDGACEVIYVTDVKWLD